MINIINAFILFILSDTCFSLSCTKQYILSDEIFLIQERAYFIGTNEPNISSITISQKQYFSLKDIYTLDNPKEYMTIQVVQTQSKISQFFNKYCCLLKNMEYIPFYNNSIYYQILCRDGFKNYKEDDNLDFAYISNQTLTFQSVGEELCEQMLIIQDKFYITCYSNKYFKILTVSQTNETSQIIYKDIAISNKCKRNSLTIANFILVIYTQCQDWIIFVIYEEQILWHFDRKIFNIQEEVLEVQHCIDSNWHSIRLYLQHNNSYSQIDFNEREYKTNFLLFIINGLFYIFLQDCYPKFIISDDNQYYLYKESPQIQKKLIKLDTNIKPKQIFLYEDSQLFLIYENKIKVIFSQGETIEYNYSLISFDGIQSSTKGTNIMLLPQYYIAIDMARKNLLFFQIDMSQPISEIYQISKQFNYLLETSPIDFLYDELIIDKCLQILVIDKDSKKIQVFDQEYIIKFLGETQSHQIFRIDKMELFSTLPLHFQIENNFQSIDINDTTSFSDFCKINAQLFNTSLQFYISKFNDTYYITFQYSDYVIFYNCDSTNNRKFNIKSSLNQQSIINIYNSILILSEDCKKLFIFSIQNVASLVKTFQFENKISKVKTTQHQIIFIYFSNPSNVQQLSLWDLRLEIKNLSECPIVQIVHYYEIYGGYLLIQFLNHIFLSEKRTKSFYLARIPSLEIVYVFYHSQSICFIGVHQENNQILKYCFMNKRLTLLNEYPLFGQQILRPLRYSLYQNILVIAMLKQNVKLLYIFATETPFIMGLKEIIEVQSFKFSVINEHLIYQDENHMLKMKNLRNYVVKISSIEICNNIKPYYNLTFKGFNNIYDDQFINTKISLQAVGCCQIYIFLKNPNPIILMKEAKQVIQVQNFLQGEIFHLKALSIDKNSQYKLLGPFNFVKKFNQCKFYGELLCFRENEDYFIKIDDNIERKISLDLLKNSQFFLLYELDDKQSLLIGVQNSLEINFHYFNFINDTFILTNTKSYTEFLGKCKCKVTGKLVSVQEFNYLWIFFIQTSQLLYKLDVKSDVIFIQESQDQYLFAHRCDYPCFIVFELKQFRNFNFDILGSIEIHKQIVENCIRNMKILINNYISKEIQLISAQLIEKSPNIILVYFMQTIEFSFINEVIISSKDLIQFSIQKILRHRESFNVEFLDSQFLVTKLEQHQIYQLYDLRTPFLMVDTIYQSNETFSINSFNTTHYILTQNEITGLGYIDYEINFNEIEETTPQNNTTLIIQAYNQISSVQFNLTILKSENILQEAKFGISWIIVILIMLIIIFCIFLLHRKHRIKASTLNQIAECKNQ